MISEKEKIILNVLLKSNTPLTIKELAKLSKIKERTLYREIKNLDVFLKNNNLELLKNKSKYSIEGDKSVIDSSILDIPIEQAYSQDTRINLILCTLLLSKETSIKELSEKLFISYNTVATVINTTEQILKDYKIILTRKKGQGITLEGLTVDKKILLLSILCNEINDEEFFYIINNINYYSANPFIKFIDVHFIREIFLQNKEISVFTTYTDSSIKKILIAINITLLIDYDTKLSDSQISSNTEQKNIQELIDILSYHNKIFTTDYFKNYMTNILKTCKLIEQVTYVNDKYSYTLIFKVHTLIKNISKKSNIDFSKDVNLANGLIAHIESAIKRYQLKLVEENNDLQAFVLKNYNELYLLVKSELLNIFDEINFDSTELSYIVIHFASSYEQIYRENFVRALVVCSSGIGSSKILGSLIRKNIPEIKNIEYSTPLKLNEDIKKNYDIIISTIKLADNIDYILIPTILQEKDVDNIRKKLLSTRSFKKHTYTGYDKEYTDLLEIDTIINNTTILKDIKNTEDTYEILNLALSFLPKQDKENIIDKLIERHKKSSIVIPETNMALFHTLDNSLIEPHIIICPLKNPINMINALDNNELVTHLFIMISPDKRTFTDLLGQISIAILEDRGLKYTIESNNINFIKTKLELIMTKYLLIQNIN
ncbi:PTS sugar transporter subunit IIA [Gemella sp. GH3]|nr:PTS sugar transporter subunit IIA [Gemella sp. GH3.1]NYS50696.1 PTS sugar transporter subunit IIA [Gemella sp. GH3]